MPRHTIIFLAAIAVMLLGCSKGTKTQSSPDTIVEANIGGKNFYIPKAYLNIRYTVIDPTGALIQAWYPGDQVVPGDPDKLWREKQWYKNVRILIEWYKQSVPLEKRIENFSKKIYHATKFVGVEYGLVHQTQPPGAMPDHDDLWIGRAPKYDPPVIIACTDANLLPAPGCKQYLDIGMYTVEINYSRRLLPHWKEIQSHVISLFNSFQSKQSAFSYFNALPIQTNQGGDQP